MLTIVGTKSSKVTFPLDKVIRQEGTEKPSLRETPKELWYRSSHSTQEGSLTIRQMA